MTNVLDARAFAWCSLGPLSEEGTSIAEDHAQGTGVLMLKGTINLEGIYRPASGTVVHLAYSDGQNWIARLPLRLRVLSCFSNPITNKTSVSVGCDLAFYENRKEPVTLDTRDENINTPEVVWRSAAPSMSAAWLTGMILCILRIRYDGIIPLTNYYTRQDFDLSAGYVEELSKLCSSEGYVCRMNPEGKAEFIAKDQMIVAGVLLTEDDLIDLNPVNSGDLPGDAVYARYNSLKLKAPDENQDNEKEREKRNWEREESFGQVETYYHDWTFYEPAATGDYRRYRDAYGNYVNASDYPGDYLAAGFRVGEGGLLEVPVYEVTGFPRREEIKYIPYSYTVSRYDHKDRVATRYTEKRDQWGQHRTYTTFRYTDNIQFGGTPANDEESANPPWEAFACEYSNEEEEDNVELPPGQIKKRKEVVKNQVDNGEVKEEVTIEQSPLGPVRMSLGLQAPYSTILQSGSFTLSKRITTYEKSKSSGITKTTTINYVPYIQTTEGSEVMSRLRDRKNPWDPIDANSGWGGGEFDLTSMATQLVQSDSSVRIRTEKEFGIQRRPSQVDRNNDANKKVPNIEQEAQITWAVGSAASQTAVELSPPYASDDRIVSNGGSFTVIESDAEQKVFAYARLENRYLFGNRNGNGIQVLPEMLPARPLSVFYIRLNGCTAAFLVNGRTWNIDPSGVTLTCDALFWGAVDGTIADAWFPLPPDAAALPAPVAIASNQNPKPANAITIPQGFSFSNPDLEQLFNDLPVNQAPVFPKTVTPGNIIKPYHETISLTAGSSSGAIYELVSWIEQPDIELIGGGSSGAIYTSVGTQWASGATTFSSGIPQLQLAGVDWLTNSTAFMPGMPAIQAEAVNWATTLTTLNPGLPADVVTLTGANWVTNATTFAPGTPAISIANGNSLTSYTSGGLTLDNFFNYDDFIGGSLVLERNGSVHTAEFFLPPNTVGPITIAFFYSIDAGSSQISSIVQTYTGTVSGVDVNSVDGLNPGDSSATLTCQFSALGGTLLSIKHTITLA